MFGGADVCLASGVTLARPAAARTERAAVTHLFSMRGFLDE
jgi:hypothetical protein